MMAMLARLGADAVLLVHFAFIVFVLAGGLLVLRHPALAWLHVPAVAWAVVVEVTGRICPLTYVENALRTAAGLAGYPGDFLSHYLLRAIYPDGLTRTIQTLLAVVVIVANGAIYAWIVHRLRARRMALP
jgi:uncharacterized protein DUF2784